MDTPSTTKRDVVTTKKRGSPLHVKACAMIDMLRSLIYGIVSTFHDKMLMSNKAGLLEND